MAVPGSSARRASIEVTAADSVVGGEIRRQGSRFVVLVDKAVIGDPSGLDTALFRLSTAIRAQLPPVAPPRWEVRVRCHSLEFSLEFTEEGSKLDGNGADCVQRVLESYPSNILSEAIEAGAQALANCCR